MSSIPSSSGSVSPSGSAGGGASPFGPLPGITVADAYTPVLVQVANPPTFPVAGTDGRFHVAYNLILQNASRVPATIDALEVVDAVDTGRVVARFAGEQLVDPGCEFGDCNRLRALPSAAVSDAVIPPQQARLLLVDYAFNTVREAPAFVMHHLCFQGAASPVITDPVPVDYTVAPYSLWRLAPS